MLPKKKRLITREFMSAMKDGKAVSGPFFTVKYRFLGDESVKFSIVVPKSVEKSAVLRNSLRRRGYASLRVYMGKMKPVFGIIFIKKEAKKLDFKAFSTELESLLKRAKILK